MDHEQRRASMGLRASFDGLAARFIAAMSGAAVAASAGCSAQTPGHGEPVDVGGPTANATEARAGTASTSPTASETGDRRATITPPTGDPDQWITGQIVCVTEARTQNLPGGGNPPTPNVGKCADWPETKGWVPCGPCGYSFNEKATREARAKHADACCFDASSPGGPGRALRGAEREPVVAQERPRVDWLSRLDPSVDVDALPAGLRATIARAWRDDAALEHASVAAFARLALELLALGAPADLVRDAHAAALDEIVHARACYAIAARFGGALVGPGPLAVEARAADWKTLFLETAVDGAFGETVAAIEARIAAARAISPAVRATLETIADDEARHAEHGWRIVAWMVSASSPHERDSLLTEARGALAARRSPASTTTNDEVDLSAFGRLATADRAALRHAVLDEIVAPCLDALARSNGANAPATKRARSRSSSA